MMMTVFVELYFANDVDTVPPRVSIYKCIFKCFCKCANLANIRARTPPQSTDPWKHQGVAGWLLTGSSAFKRVVLR